MKSLEDLKEMLEDELKKITKKGDISPTELENAYKAVDILKDIETIKAMKEQEEEKGQEGQSQRGRGRMYSMEGDYSQDGYSQRYMPMMPRYVNSMAYEGGTSNNYANEQGGSQRGGQGMSNGYSYEYSNAYDGGMSNAGKRGMDGDGDGRYSEEGSYRRGRDMRTGRYVSRDSYERGYSRHGQKERMMEKLEDMLQEAGTPKERQAIMQCIDKLDM